MLVCIKYDHMEDELQKIKKTMMLNGYPKSIIDWGLIGNT